MFETNSYALSTAAAEIQRTKRRFVQSERYKKRKESYSDYLDEVAEIMEDAEANSNDKQYASEREGEKIDPETGLYLTKGRMSTERNLERINPSFDCGNKMFKVNCNLCTMAMELRERGYDVHAGTGDEDMLYLIGIRDSEKKNNWYAGESPYKNTKTYNLRKEDSRENIMKDIAKEPNSRGEIFLDWKWNGGGHSMYYKVDSKGKVTFYDAQSNEKYKGWKFDEDCLAYAEYAEYTRLDQATPNTQYLVEHNYIC